MTGIPLADLADGAMLTGYANNEPILLVRRGDEYLAISAKCTHHGAPLDQGLLVDDTVRCPWHHACFSLRTGEALRAPALDPLPCWEVKHREGRVYVTGKQERDPLASLRPATAAPGSTHPQSVVIVGGGAAGSAAAEMLRREGYTGRLTLLDGESEAPYDRPHISKEFPDEAESIALRPPGFYEAHGVEVVHEQVAYLDVKARQVRTAGGSSYPYEALVLATGAEPVRLDIAGADLPHVHVLRSLADHAAVVAGAQRAQRVVVLGASFIGLEVAAGLRARGLEVHVVAPDQIPLARVLGPELGALVQAKHEQQGVVFHLQQKAARIEINAVILENGESLMAELVVVGIGVRPRLALAEAAGLVLDRGVVVNEFLETSIPGIYAVGDIARWPDRHTGQRIRVEHWAVAQRQGQTAARNVLGQRERFEAVPFFWSQHYNLSVRYSGHAEQWDQLTRAGSPAAGPAASFVFRLKGRTLAVASMQRDVENLQAEVALESNDEAVLARLFPEGATPLNA